MQSEAYDINSNEIVDIRNILMDEESRDIFDIRMDYVFNRDYSRLENMFLDYQLNKGVNFHIEDWENFKRNNECNKIAIFGTGHDGKATYKLLKKSDNIVCFVDNYNAGVYEGLPILSVDELLNGHEDIIVVLASRNNLGQMYRQLLAAGYDNGRIFYPYLGRIIGFYNQYFDLYQFQHCKEEVFIDAGGFDGKTSVDFSNWANGIYKKIYMFEPDKQSWGRIEKTLKEYALQDVNVIKKGLYSKDAVLNFKSDGGLGGSQFYERGDIAVNVTSLDKTLNGERCTFIKMDIEGLEYEALIGAKKSIKEYTPKLAICAYHKPLDVVVLPKLILSINSNYEFYLRHYSTCSFETVLYAVPA